MLDQRIGRHGDAVAEIADGGVRGIDAAGALHHGVGDAARWIVGGGGDLPDLDPAAVFVGQADISESAARIDADTPGLRGNASRFRC